MLISSASNPQIKHIRRLCLKRRARDAHRQFFVEGVQAIYKAYVNGWEVKQLIYCPALVGSDWGRKTLALSDPQTHLQSTEYVYEKLATRSYSELMAVVSEAADDLARIPVPPNLLVTVVDRPRTAGNLGAIIRSTDAMGGHGVLVMEPAVDVYDPKTVRSTMGSLFSLPVVRVGTPEIFHDWIGRVRESLPDLRVAATSPHASAAIDRCDFTAPTVLIIGTERTGVHEHFNAVCDAAVTIPMSGAADSLNSSMSAAIVLYEVNRQRLAARRCQESVLNV
jgi:TrmH family RNA methyltransferase